MNKEEIYNEEDSSHQATHFHMVQRCCRSSPESPRDYKVIVKNPQMIKEEIYNEEDSSHQATHFHAASDREPQWLVSTRNHLQSLLC